MKSFILRNILCSKGYSDVNTANITFLLTTVNMVCYFLSFAFYLFVSLYLIYVSCKQQITGYCFLSNLTICHLNVFRSFIHVMWILTWVGLNLLSCYMLSICPTFSFFFVYSSFWIRYLFWFHFIYFVGLLAMQFIVNGSALEFLPILYIYPLTYNGLPSRDIWLHIQYRNLYNSYLVSYLAPQLSVPEVFYLFA